MEATKKGLMMASGSLRNSWEFIKRNREELWSRLRWFAAGAFILYKATGIAAHGSYAWGDLPVAAWTGWGGVVLGSVFIMYGVLGASKSINWRDQNTVCPKCLKPYPQDWKGGASCPQCGVPLESLDGFYDRHPELRDPAPQNAPKPRN